MEWRRAALASLTQELARSAHAEAPLDSATEQQSPADALTDEDPALSRRWRSSRRRSA
jgi:hypothetical protein